MESKLKIIGKKLLVVMVSCLMLLGMTPVTRQAFAETQHNDVITDVKLTKEDLTTPVGSIGYGQQMQFVAKFSLPNNKVHTGDKTVIPVPKELEIYKKETFPVKNANGDTIANAVVDPATKTITMTYTDYVESHSDITGSLHVTVIVDSNIVKTAKKLHLKVTMGNGASFDLGELDYKGIQGDSPDESLMKWSFFDKDDPTILHCRIRVNAKGGNFPYISVKDTLESPSVSYLKESLQIKKGKWELPAGGGYYTLKNEIDVTNQFKPITYSGNSFTVRFNNIQGEGYAIKYDVKLGYTPVNQEKIKNRIFGETNGQVLINTVVEATYQQSGGEANGYNYTIKIHKESEDGQNLKGAVFEVIRNSSHAKVGEITTDSNGNGSLGGLLKDNYTIREKKAPEGYIPLDSDIHVTPADFGADKAVLKTIKNKKNPKINICGEKTWDDANNQDKKRPDKITVILLANGKPIQNPDVKPDENGKWKYIFKNLPKYDDKGKEIKYTVKEEPVAGYKSKVDGYNITNSYKPEETSVKVTKKWDDADNQDGKRPESIKVQLYGNDKKVGDEVTLNEGNKWTHTWEKLPKNEAGNPIKYTVKEVNVGNGYKSAITGSAEDGFTVTNTRKPETIKVEGEKTWDDADDQDGKRPTSITVKLLANGKKVAEKTVTKDDNWKYSFTDLPKYEKGQEIKYTVTENPVGEYNFSSNGGYNIKNSYTPGKTSVTVTKRWDDAGNQDGKRPNSIKVQLYGNDEKVGDEVELTDGNWTHTWNDLPEKKAGKTIKYTVKEVGTVDGYTTNIDNSNTGNIIICNKHTPEKTKVEGEKTWNDADDQDGKRPKEITVNLLANGKKVKEAKVTADTNWKYSFTDLPKYEKGQEIKYTVTENAVAEYTPEINGPNIKNSYTPEETSVTVTKGWNDANDQDGKRPKSIKVQLYGDDKKVGDEVELSEGNGWTHTWTKLPKKAKGKDIKYEVKEVTEVDGYTTEIDNSDIGNIRILNSHTPETTEIKGKKTWNDGDNQDGNRPKEITVNLLANGKKIKEAKATADTNWEYSFTDLPKYEGGKEIEYTVTENTVKGYSTDIKGYDIENSYTPKKTSVTVTKRWNDSNDKDKIRPDSIKVQLYANGEKKGEAVQLKAENKWTYTWKDLPQKENGKDIKYTVKEVGKLKGYTVKVDDKNHGNIIITNTHTPKDVTNPETGDTNRLIPYILMLLLSVTAFMGIFTFRKLRRSQL